MEVDEERTIRTMEDSEWDQTMTKVTYQCRDKIVDILQTTSSDACCCIKIVVLWFTFYWDMFPRVQFPPNQHGFRSWLAVMIWTTRYLNIEPMYEVSELLSHIKQEYRSMQTYLVSWTGCAGLCKKGWIITVGIILRSTVRTSDITWFSLPLLLQNGRTETGHIWRGKCWPRLFGVFSIFSNRWWF